MAKSERVASSMTKTRSLGTAGASRTAIGAYSRRSELTFGNTKKRPSGINSKLNRVGNFAAARVESLWLLFLNSRTKPILRRTSGMSRSSFGGASLRTNTQRVPPCKKSLAAMYGRRNLSARGSIETKAFALSASKMKCPSSIGCEPLRSLGIPLMGFGISRTTRCGFPSPEASNKYGEIALCIVSTGSPPTLA